MIAYRKADLVFQDYATRRFFLHSYRANQDLKYIFRISAPQAHLDIFVACVNLILGLGWTKFHRSIKHNSLQEYALRHWQKHLGELDINKTTDTDVIRVVRTLYRISVNAELFATALQRHGPEVDLVLPERKPESTSWYDQFDLWVKRAATLGPDAMPDDIQQWIRGPVEEQILLPLARGHLKAWFFETRQWGFVYSYQLGRRCIQLVSVHMQWLVPRSSSPFVVSSERTLFSRLRRDRRDLTLRKIIPEFCLRVFEIESYRGNILRCKLQVGR